MTSPATAKCMWPAALIALALMCHGWSVHADPFVTFTFGGTVTQVGAQCPPPEVFADVMGGDSWSLTYTFDAATLDVDGSPNDGQYREAVTEITLTIATTTVSGLAGPALPNESLSSVIGVNLVTSGFADYVVQAGLPDASAWATVGLYDDSGTPFADDSLPLDLPTLLADAFPSLRTFSLRAPGSTLVCVEGTVSSFQSPAGPTGFVSPEAVSIGAGSSVSSVIVLFEERFLARDHILTLRLTELRESGAEVPLGEQMIATRNLARLSSEAGLLFVDVFWEKVDPVANGSRILACAQILQHMVTTGEDELLAEGCNELELQLDGFDPSAFDEDAFVRRYDVDGNEVWTRQFGSNPPRRPPDLAQGVGVDAAGNVYVAGWTSGTFPGQTKCVPPGINFCTDGFLRKYDAAGNELWTRQFGNDSSGNDRFVTVHGVGVDELAVYVVGETNGTFPGQSRDEFDHYAHGFLRKYDVDGNEVWTRQFRVGTNTTVQGVAIGASGVYVVGRTPMFDDDAYVRKYDADGNAVWTRIFGFGTASDFVEDAANAVAVGASGIYVLGETCVAVAAVLCTTDQGNRDRDVFLRKYDLDGSELWTRQFGTTLSERANAVALDASGVYVAGTTPGTLPGEARSCAPESIDPPTCTDVFVRKYDLDGNELWTRQFGTQKADEANGVALDASGVYVAGGTYGIFPGQIFEGLREVLVRKYDADGNELWTRQFGTARSDTARAIAVDAIGVYVAGGAKDQLVNRFTVTSTNDSGPGSLRQTISDANSVINVGSPDEIEFDIPVTDPGFDPGRGPEGAFTIRPLSQLPTITDPVVIDGYTQPGALFPVSGSAELKIEVDGATAGTAAGLLITAGGSTVRGLAINRFLQAIEIRTAGGNVISGNYLGIDLNGTLDLGNFRAGVLIVGAPENIIGARNVISGNDLAGVLIQGSQATGNLVQGNYIGTDATGLADLGNSQSGVIILGAAGNTIGGTTGFSSRNIISGNDVDGVEIQGSGATGNLVQGNFIGTDLKGRASLGNSLNGVSIAGGSDNTVGGTASFAGNTIAFNGGAGVFVQSGTGNAVLSNAIFSNAGLGIDLAPSGITANDAGDGDTGANNLQNSPILTAAISGSVRIEGTLNSTANTTFRLEFFASTAGDPSGHGEAERFLGSSNLTTDGSGSGNFITVIPASSALIRCPPRRWACSSPRPRPTPATTPRSSPTSSK